MNGAGCALVHPSVAQIMIFLHICICLVFVLFVGERGSACKRPRLRLAQLVLGSGDTVEHMIDFCSAVSQEGSGGVADEGLEGRPCGGRDGTLLCVTADTYDTQHT